MLSNIETHAREMLKDLNNAMDARHLKAYLSEVSAAANRPATEQDKLEFYASKKTITEGYAIIDGNKY